MAELRPGMVIDKHELIERIGQGGMGEVWKAQHVFLKQRAYAIKVMLPGTHLLEENVKRFLREAEARLLRNGDELAMSGARFRVETVIG